jgi:hypothetical protein
MIKRRKSRKRIQIGRKGYKYSKKEEEKEKVMITE